MDILFVADPLESFKIYKETTFAMMREAQRRGHSLSACEPRQLVWQRGGVMQAQTRRIRLTGEAQDWFHTEATEVRALHAFDAIVMRKDPPFDNEYIYSTYILEQAESAGCLVVNRPRSLRDCNEKLFATQFPQCCPPLVVSNNATVLKHFHVTHGDVIFKPLDGMGGSSIFRLRHDDPNVSVIIETLTGHGRTPIMAQRFIPEIVKGDKRILLVDGDPVPYALARVPARGETRGNLAAGGSGVPQPLSDRDRWICSQVRESVREKGLLFVGLDVIGDYLTEINVTSPTCVRELNKAYNLDIAGDLMRSIESRLVERRQS